MIVLDASAALELLLRAASHRRLVARALDSGSLMVAPHLLDLEVVHVLRKYVASGDLPISRAEQALADYGDFRITRYAHQPFLARIWELRKNCTAYDAAYIALAEALDAPFVTCDKRLTTAPGHRAVVEYFHL